MTVKQTARTRRAALQAAESIPPLPDNVVRVLAMLNEADTEPEDLVVVLERDPVLVGRMLAMANSPFYGVANDITSVKQGVLVLGFRGVRSLVLATSTSKFMKQDFSVYGHDRDGLWKHAVVVSALAREIASALRMSADTREELFLAGLLHDIGKMVLVQPLTQSQWDAQKNGPATAEVERERTGIDHGESGSLVLSKWNLSMQVQDLVAHHDVDAEAEGTVTREALVLQVANDLANAIGIGYAHGLAPARQIEDPAEVLGLGVEEWQAIDERAGAAAQTALEQFV